MCSHLKSYALIGYCVCPVLPAIDHADDVTWVTCLVTRCSGCLHPGICLRRRAPTKQIASFLSTHLVCVLFRIATSFLPLLLGVLLPVCPLSFYFVFPKRSQSLGAGGNALEPNPKRETCFKQSGDRRADSGWSAGYRLYWGRGIPRGNLAGGRSIAPDCFLKLHPRVCDGA